MKKKYCLNWRYFKFYSKKTKKIKIYPSLVNVLAENTRSAEDLFDIKQIQS